MPNELRNFLTHSYDELEEMNLKAKEQRRGRVAPHKIQEDRIKYLTDEKRRHLLGLFHLPPTPARVAVPACRRAGTQSCRPMPTFHRAS